jgi:hypothetical protein
LSIDYSSRKNCPPPGFRHDVGTEFDLPLPYKLTEGISFIGGLNKFYMGHFFEKALGSKKNIEYAYMRAEVEFCRPLKNAHLRRCSMQW